MYFTLYCIIKKNKPKVYPSIILPGLVKLKADVSNYFDLNLNLLFLYFKVSGWMWGIGNSSFFLANNALTQAITFPIVSSGPSAISALWGVILFKEIKGTKNFVLLGFGFVLALVGSILCGISK